MPFDARFQVLTLPNRDWSAYLDQVQQIERLAFDIVSVPDLFVDWAKPPAPWLECWTSLGAAAAVTSTIRLSTFVTQIPLRNPGVLAHQAITVDQISAGRLELGLGTGLRIDPGTEMIGLSNWSNAERVERFGEYVQIIDLLSSQESTTFAGEYYSVTDAVMNPTSVQRPRIPILVAALGPRMMRHAAEHADIWNTMSFAPDFDAQLDEVSERTRRIEEECRSSGRDPDSLRRSISLFDATARASGGRIRYYDDEDLFVSLVLRFAHIGFTDFNLYYPSVEDQIPAFERLALDVIPELRASL